MSALPRPEHQVENESEEVAHPGFLRWHKRVLAFCVITFALELGLFLVVYPWSHKWEMNFIPIHIEQLRDLWANRFFRGAVSGLGILDLWIAGAEFWRLLRSGRR
jgi:hypothetical protein